MSDLVPRKTLVKQGGQAIGGVAGGIVLLALAGLHGIPGLIVGGVVAAIGLVISGSKSDRTAGLITIGAGVLTAIGAFTGVGHGLMVVSGIGLLIMGGINLFKFIKGYRKRI